MLWIDGSTSPDRNEAIWHGYTKGHSDHPPFAVFDDKKQDWVFVSRWLWLCRLYRWWHEQRA